MNRFEAAGVRAYKRELMRKGSPQFMMARIPVPEGTEEGDTWQAGHYLATADQDRGEDGQCAVSLLLDPTPESIADDTAGKASAAAPGMPEPGRTPPWWASWRAGGEWGRPLKGKKDER